jgi:hypothetical protein
MSATQPHACGVPPLLMTPHWQTTRAAVRPLRARKKDPQIDVILRRAKSPSKDRTASGVTDAVEKISRLHAPFAFRSTPPEPSRLHRVPRAGFAAGQDDIIGKQLERLSIVRRNYKAPVILSRAKALRGTVRRGKAPLQ